MNDKIEILVLIIALVANIIFQDYQFRKKASERIGAREKSGESFRKEWQDMTTMKNFKLTTSHRRKYSTSCNRTGRLFKK